MGQFFGIEEIKLMSKSSQTTVDWAAGSTLRIGGQGYTVNSVLTMDLATDIDTGAVAADTKYYIYAVVINKVVSLKYSLSNTAPTGYSAYKKLGDCSTDATPEIIAVSNDSRITEIKDVVYSPNFYYYKTSQDYRIWTHTFWVSDGYYDVDISNLKAGSNSTVAGTTSLMIDNVEVTHRLPKTFYEPLIPFEPISVVPGQVFTMRFGLDAGTGSASGYNYNNLIDGFLVLTKRVEE